MQGVRHRAWFAALLLTASLACDSSADVPSKSRVQSVLAEPEPPSGSSAKGAAPVPPASLTPTAEPRPVPPRPPLCEGQLTAKARAFKPALAPRQLSGNTEGGAGNGALPVDVLKAARGHWLWLNFWAAWCVPCREELPLLFSWQEQLADRATFAFLSMDDDGRQLRAFLEKQPPTGLRRTHWLPDGAVRKAWLDALGLETEPELPFQVLIDPKGMLRCQVGGAVEAKDLSALRQIVSAKK